MKRIVEFARPDLFILPVIKYVCKPRGLPVTEVHTLFTTTCEKCGSEVPGEALPIAAIMTARTGSPGPHAWCKKCGHSRMIAALTTLSHEEESLLSNDEFFMTLALPGSRQAKRPLTAEEMNCLFCSPTFVKQYVGLFDFSNPLSATSEEAKDRFLEQLSQEDVDRFVEEGRQILRRRFNAEQCASKEKRWWEFWK